MPAVRRTERAMTRARQIDENLALYKDRTGVVHFLAWDDDIEAWFYICHTITEVTKAKGAKWADRWLKFATCLRCADRVKWP